MRSLKALCSTRYFVPAGMQSPQEASSAVDLSMDPGETMGPVYPTPIHGGGNAGGLFGWFSGSNFVNKVVEKTKVISVFHSSYFCLFTSLKGVKIMIFKQFRNKYCKAAHIRF